MSSIEVILDDIWMSVMVRNADVQLTGARQYRLYQCVLEASLCRQAAVRVHSW